MTENSIEFITNDTTATVTFSQGRYISRIKKLAEKHGKCEIVEQPETNGGYLLAHIPVDWVKITPTRKISDTERARLAEMARNNLHKGTTGR